MELYLQNTSGIRLPLTREEMAAIIGTVLKKEKKLTSDTELSIVFITPESIESMNSTFRHINEPTDVLSFPAAQQDMPLTMASFLGDIAICPQIIKKQAKDFSVTFKQEFAFILIHGLLHLCGYDHMNHEDTAAMRKKENYYLTLLNFHAVTEN